MLGDGLLAPDYLTARAQLVSAERTMPTVAPGNPAGVKVALADGPKQVENGTSHFAVIDRNGPRGGRRRTRRAVPSPRDARRKRSSRPWWEEHADVGRPTGAPSVPLLVHEWASWWWALVPRATSPKAKGPGARTMRRTLSGRGAPLSFSF